MKEDKTQVKVFEYCIYNWSSRVAKWEGMKPRWLVFVWSTNKVHDNAYRRQKRAVFQIRTKLKTRLPRNSPSENQARITKNIL